jgi:hypothetical protein
MGAKLKGRGEGNRVPSTMTMLWRNGDFPDHAGFKVAWLRSKLPLGMCAANATWLAAQMLRQFQWQ